MRKATMEDGSIKYSDSMKHQVGSWYENWAIDKWYIIETAEAGEVMGEYGIDKVWLHTMREATTAELAQKAEQKAEWEAKTPDGRISETMSSLANEFPGLDW